MNNAIFRSIAPVLLLVLGWTLAAQAPATAEPNSSKSPTIVADSDSRNTRQELSEILRRLPPDVGRVLKLDPALWTNQTYLANYPALAAFVTNHPEVAHSPAFFLENVWIQRDAPAESEGIRLWRSTMEGMTIFAVFVSVALVLAWLIRTLIEQRRWSRLAKTQAEVHNKLLDRFASNAELMAYIQTPAGSRFLESAPIPIESGSRPIGAPISRILWSVQAGLVLVAGGFGLELISGQAEVVVAQQLAAIGVLAIAIGIGFVVSAAASYFLSRRLGLLQAGDRRADSDSE